MWLLNLLSYSEGGIAQRTNKIQTIVCIIDVFIIIYCFFFFFIERVKKVCKHLSPRWTFVSAEWEMLSGSPQCIYGLLYRCTYSVIQGMLGTHEANYQQLTSFQTHGQYHSKALIPHTHTNTHTGYGTNSYRDTRWIIENRQYVTLHLSIRV